MAPSLGGSRKRKSCELQSKMEKGLFKKGRKVEACFDEPGIRGAWFTATVLRPPRRDKKVHLEFQSLLNEEGSSERLKEKVTVVNVRPPPPLEFHRTFKMSDEVDAFHDDGWWEGVITKVHDKDRFSVYFRNSKDELVFPAANLRLHREWVDGSWVPPIEEIYKSNVWRSEGNNMVKPEGPSKKYSSKSKIKFEKGTQVEISSDEEGYVGAWFVATYVKKVGNKYLVEHKHFTTDDGTELLKEEVDAQHIRPLPPEILIVDRFKRLEAVDAWFNDTWWVGMISKVLDNSKYIVYFKNTREEMVFQHSSLRLHQDCIDDQWIRASRA
ncbi:protein AGENET DOMAIN (AGD)-CONTAINING P1-like isoform X2 [Macadamia integrifolia]|uniref:protein AGENET DOMAIN (AGD)-CONTAINING P1-like isoform X2 n=1 Tax=Macadamia integrifolia TaxID=60698 RepID=UPI001C4FD03B|nr:protein AGENET DOMAIN (AGD)-CONTAINING P1-like isoform X2 [Macadamia integrifolia]